MCLSIKVDLSFSLLLFRHMHYTHHTPGHLLFASAPSKKIPDAKVSFQSKRERFSLISTSTHYNKSEVVKRGAS